MSNYQIIRFPLKWADLCTTCWTLLMSILVTSYLTWSFAFEGIEHAGNVWQCTTLHMRSFCDARYSSQEIFSVFPPSLRLTNADAIGTQQAVSQWVETHSIMLEPAHDIAKTMPVSSVQEILALQWRTRNILPMSASRKVTSFRLLFPWQWHCLSRILTLVQAPVQSVANWRLNLENPWRSCTTTSEVQESEFVLTSIAASSANEHVNWSSKALILSLILCRSAWPQSTTLSPPWSLKPRSLKSDEVQQVSPFFLNNRDIQIWAN